MVEKKKKKSSDDNKFGFPQHLSFCLIEFLIGNQFFPFYVFTLVVDGHIFPTDAGFWSGLGFPYEVIFLLLEIGELLVGLDTVT
jgi:hypothetical protein